MKDTGVRRFVTLCLACAVAVAGALAAHGQAAPPPPPPPPPPQAPSPGPDVLGLLRSFEADVKAVQDAAARNKAQIRDRCATALAEMEKRFQAAGLLESTLAVRAERKRLSDPQAGKEPALEGVEEPRELTALRSNYLAALQEASIAEAQLIVPLADACEKKLAEQQSSLTRLGRVEEALAVRHQRQRLAEHPAVSSSRFVLADARPQLPDSPTGRPLPSGHVPPAPAVSPASLTRIQMGQIERRFKDLFDACREWRWDDAVQYVDPRIVETEGREKVMRALRIGLGVPWVQTKRLRSMRLPPDGIELDARAATARVSGQYYFAAVQRGRRTGGGGWRNMPPTQWVMVDNKWYVRLHVPSEANADTQRPNPGRLRLPLAPGSGGEPR